MAIIVKRKNREIRDSGTITFDVGFGDVGKTLDFMGIAEGFRIVAVNVSIDEKFNGQNATPADDNTISVGIEGDYARFIPATIANTVKGIDFNKRQFTATQSTAIVVDLVGGVATTGKATITVTYAKLATSKQEY